MGFSKLSFLWTSQVAAGQRRGGGWRGREGGGSASVSCPRCPDLLHASWVCMSAHTPSTPTTSLGKRPQDETCFASMLILDFFLEASRTVKNPLLFSSCPVCATLSWQLGQTDRCDIMQRHGYLYWLKRRFKKTKNKTKKHNATWVTHPAPG